MSQPFAIAIHGGAGTITPDQLTPEKEAAYLAGIEAAVGAGFHLLHNGGTAEAAVIAATKSLEDCPLFNAGRGAVFNCDGAHELDASLMVGHTGMAGAVAGVKGIKNPIELAQLVKDNSPHVLLIGTGAEKFAIEHGISLEPESYFFDAYRYQQWQEAKAADRIQLDHSDKKFGTVGAVALDVHGHLAAATSTGGMTNKAYGRVGDTPLIGAGTWADKHCAISCTGHGEYFIRQVVAYDIAALMRYAHLSLEEATNHVVKEKLAKVQGEGGVIAINKQGEISLCFNSAGMYRGFKHSNGSSLFAIYD